ncbi:hypothetical protein [Thermospira aquatica]|uniref:Uncharacterized protein n=1 Tax=Thermospira aquatica TaxID=2828656 RepID=A0AAX3BF90_9SPIR|nr:hypothetical protein [Thermospira aquatica]URA10924.1 hypothetical protein KDW03_03735 [Thermospira aquatica]
MGNIRLYAIIFGFIFLFRLLALGPWIGYPLFSPFQIATYQYLLGERFVSPQDEDTIHQLAVSVIGYRWLLWGMEIMVDGISWLGMIGLVLKREFFSRIFWRFWIFLCIFWQIFISLWLGLDFQGIIVWLLISATGPFLLFIYGWKRQWLQRRVE